MMEGVSEDWFIPDSCSPGQTYDRSMGYLKIEGDKCAGGEESLFSYRKAKCPDTSEYFFCLLAYFLDLNEAVGR